MSYSKVLARLYKLNRESPFKYNNDAVSQLSKYFGSPHKNIDAIHVTGTNGKGSTCYKLAQVLIDNNIKTGLFTSPHLTTFRERIQINNEYVTEEFIIDYLNTVFDGLDSGKFNCSFFEALTVMSFLYFKEMKTDVAVIEVGIGGRRDCTNILEKKLLNIVTSVGLDHTNILGNTVEEILINKSGICLPKVPMLIGSSVPPIIPRTLAKSMGSDFYITKEHAASGGVFKSSEDIVRTAIDILNSKYNMDLTIRDEVIKKNLKGRMEKVNPANLKKLPFKQVPRSVTMDIGHNTSAMHHCLSNSTEFNKDDLIIVYGTSKKKDSMSVFPIFNQHASSTYVIESNSPRAKSGLLMTEEAKAVNCDVNYISEGNIKATLDHIINTTPDIQNKDIFVAGSFFIMEEVRDYFLIEDEKDPYFLNEVRSF